MLFVLSVTGMMGAFGKASHAAASATGLASFCDPGSTKGPDSNAQINHCDLCLVSGQRDPAPDLSTVEGTSVVLPAPVDVAPFAPMAEPPQPKPALVERRATPPRAPPATA